MNAKPSTGRGRIALVLVAAVSAGLVTGIAVAAARIDVETRPRIGGWPEDVNGDGIISDSKDERIPELISAVGDSGVEGYVLYDDLQGPQPSTPEEALAMSGQERVIPVYAEDGTTVVDHYTLTAGNEATATPTPSTSP